MAKPADRDIEALYAEAAEHGLTRDQVDAIAIPLITGMFVPPTGLGSVRSHRQLREITAAVRDAYPVAVETTAGQRDLPRATPRQVSYIRDLLSRRLADGDASGYMGVSSLITSTGVIDLDAIGALTRARASQVISSLRGDY